MITPERCLDLNSQFLLIFSKDSDPKGLGIQPWIFLRFPKSGCECTISKRKVSPCKISLTSALDLRFEI